MLVAVIFMLAILILSLTVALPKVREDIRRDREIETMHRGKQYVRAIKLYYKKFNAYPPNVDALVKTNNFRFLRKKYVDPTTGKEEWKPVLFGQNKTPTAMGFFGKPLSGSTLAGIGPSGGNLNGSSAGGGISSIGGGGTSSAGGGIFGAGGATDSGSGATGTSTGGTDTGGGTTSSSAGSNNPTGNGQSFGGGGIIGFSPTSPKQSILVLKKKNHYNEWEFTYDPIQDQQMMGGGTNGTGLNPANGNNPTVGNGMFGGNNNNAGGNNANGNTNSNGTGAPPVQSPSPPQP
jgi:type II secretory pathway pseudopilin PulG